MKTTRRDFIKTTAAVAGFYLLPSGLLAKAPNSRSCPAHIGLGGRGTRDLSLTGDNDRTEVVGLCDVDVKQHREEISHYDQWVDAIFDPSMTLTANFDHASHLTEAVLLGGVAGRFPNQRLTWDAPSMKITNNEAANQYVEHAYRTGY